jgi:hypothetical protein
MQFAGWGVYFWSQASGDVVFADAPWGKSATVWGGFCVSGVVFETACKIIENNFECWKNTASSPKRTIWDWYEIPSARPAEGACNSSLL